MVSYHFSNYDVLVENGQVLKANVKFKSCDFYPTLEKFADSFFHGSTTEIWVNGEHCPSKSWCIDDTLLRTLPNGFHKVKTMWYNAWY